MYLNEIVFNHHSFVSIHWELLREESNCKAVSQDKGSCRVLHCSSSAPEENKNRVFEAYSFEAGIYRVLSLKHLLKTTYKVGNGIVTSIPSSSSSLMLRLSFHSRLFWKWRYTGSAATWLLESQIYYNNQTLNGDVLVVGIEI
ncbi:hypothetical protein ACFXTH_000950 [Malus domestica]